MTKKTLLITALAAIALLGTSCIGGNRAFRGVHSWNTRVTDSKWGNELIHLGLWILPFYPLCLTGDLLLFNPIEFWFGKNVLNEPDPPKPIEK